MGQAFPYLHRKLSVGHSFLMVSHACGKVRDVIVVQDTTAEVMGPLAAFAEQTNRLGFGMRMYRRLLGYNHKSPVHRDMGGKLQGFDGKAGYGADMIAATQVGTNSINIWGLSCTGQAVVRLRGYVGADAIVKVYALIPGDGLANIEHLLNVARPATRMNVV